MSQDGALFHWNYSSKSSITNDANGIDGPDVTSRWRIAERRYFMQMNAKVKCATYHAKTKLLVVGFSNGLFGLYELPEFNMIHTLRSIAVTWI